MRPRLCRSSQTQTPVCSLHPSQPRPFVCPWSKPPCPHSIHVPGCDPTIWLCFCPNLIHIYISALSITPLEPRTESSNQPVPRPSLYSATSPAPWGATMHYYHGPSTLSEGFPSSPPAGTSSPANSSLSPSRASQRKEKRNPSVTPRRFGRFFTPRSSLPGGGRRILGMLDDSSTNTRQQISPQSILTDPLDSDPICPSSPTERLGGLDSDASKRKWHESSQQALKRRRGLVSDDMPPPQFNLPGLSARSFRDENMQTADGNAAIRSSPDVLAEKRKATLVCHFNIFKVITQGIV